MPEIIVIGCGVSGLSSAVRLQQAGFDVSILTRDRPQFTTSMAAGAVWYGGGSLGKAREWAELTLDHFMALAKQADTGVQVVRLREVFPHPMTDPWYKDLIPHFDRIDKDQLPVGSVAGFVVDVPIVESPRYLQYLHDQFIDNGGTIELREIKMLDDLKYDASLLVNCTGVWAKQVADDPTVFPIRGQTLVVDAPHITEGFMNDHNFTYVFPRGDGVLVGGVAEPDVWDLELDKGLSADILARCTRIEPSIAEAPILKQFVGLRPGRTAVRLDSEKLSDNCTVIHNYGHAGLGYTLSWGCAGEVVTLAKNLSE